MPKRNPQLTIETASNDPLNMDFSVHDSKTGEDLAAFRADNIVQQRNFMAALGGKGPGLFTQSPNDSLTDSEDQTESASDGVRKKLLERKKSYEEKRMSARLPHVEKCLPSYSLAMKHLPKEFYFPDQFEHSSESGTKLPIYDVSSRSPTEVCLGRFSQLSPTAFLPPFGPPVHHPVSMGYGAEASLKDHQQVVWDPLEKFFYFLDHIERKSFLSDPRPEKLQKPALPGTVITSFTRLASLELHYGQGKREDFSMEVSSDPDVLRAASARAATKPHGLVVKACGKHGQRGAGGSKGSNGTDGENGSIGSHQGLRDGGLGADGLPGQKGQDATSGTPGSDASDVILQLSGDVSELEISGSFHSVAHLGGEQCEEIVFVDCRGGDGGDGGEGGDGAKGGAGGDGGKGVRDGDGGFGGDGASGGSGGCGGNGGSAGKGGRCIFEAVDPRLLMLVETNVLAGSPGRGGSGGVGGEGGRRGFGGEPGNELDPHFSSELAGRKGKPGMSGPRGISGTKCLDGSAAEDGGILWVIRSQDGAVLHSAGTRYDAAVTSLNVSSDTTSELYQPNQRITVSEVTVVNSGELPLPAGAKVSFPSTETVQFESTTFTLPQLEPNETFLVPVSFKGRIFDQETPNLPGTFSSSASFSPRIELLGRPFEKSFLEQTLPVQYPVRLSFALSTRNIGRGEVAILEIGVENISSCSFGRCSDAEGSVKVKVCMNPNLLPLGLFAGDESKADALPYSVTSKPSSPNVLDVCVKQVKASETLVIPIAVYMNTEAELFDSCVWQADLYLKGKLIGYLAQEIRVSPAYSLPSNHSHLGDVLMITSEAIMKEEFALWKRIYEIAGVNVDYWDSSYSKRDPQDNEDEETNTPLRHPQKKMPDFIRQYSGKLVVYPHCSLDSVPVEEIVSHFHRESDSSSQEFVDSRSSMLLFLSSTFPENLEEYHLDHMGPSKLLRHLCHNQKSLKLQSNSYSGYHLLAPGTLLPVDWSTKRAEKNTIKKLKKDCSSQAVALVGHSSVIHHERGLKYSYGSMDVRRCPILQSCSFQCVDGAGGSMTSMGIDDPLLTPLSREVPLGSKFGQVLVCVVSGIPLQNKLSLLRKSDDTTSANYVRLCLPNGCFLNRQELAAICLASDITDEVLNCNGVLTRMDELIADVEEHKAFYTSNAAILDRLVELIKREMTERKKFADPSQVAPSVKEMNRLCSGLSGALKSSHGPTCSLLPSLKLLQDGSQVLRSHQVCPEAECYRLTSS